MLFCLGAARGNQSHFSNAAYSRRWANTRFSQPKANGVASKLDVTSLSNCMDLAGCHFHFPNVLIQLFLFFSPPLPVDFFPTCISCTGATFSCSIAMTRLMCWICDPRQVVWPQCSHSTISFLFLFFCYLSPLLSFDLILPFFLLHSFFVCSLPPSFISPSPF